MEGGVADGEDFVDEQNFRFEMGGDGEGEAHLHAAAVVLEGSVEEAFHFGEGHDLVELAADFCGAHAEDGAAHEHIFAAGELGVETGADFEKAADAAVKLGVSFGGAGDAGQDFQQRALAGAVAADQAHHFAFFYVEGDVLQRPDVGRAAASCFSCSRSHSRSCRCIRPAAQQAKRGAQNIADHVAQSSSAAWAAQCGSACPGFPLELRYGSSANHPFRICLTQDTS